MEAYTIQKAALPPQVKSILKPAIPLSPPKQIPPHSSTRRTSPAKSKPRLIPEKASEGFLIDTSVPDNGVSLSGSALPNPFGDSPPKSPTKKVSHSPSRSQTKIAIRTEEEQQAAAREKERQEILAHRDARRKSLGQSPCVRVLFGKLKRIY